MQVITDLRTLKKFERLYDLQFDRTYKYMDGPVSLMDNYELLQHRGLAPKEYKLKFFDGCFCPYLVKMEGGE